MSRLHELLRLDGTGAARRRKPSLPGIYHFDPTALENRIDLVLTAPTFDFVAADALAARDVYADTVARLHRDLGRYRIASLLAVAPREFWPLRLARAFGAVPHDHWIGERYTPDDLRASKHPEVRTALAALGEIPWPDMSCRERSAFLLTYIVTRMRRGDHG